MTDSRPGFVTVTLAPRGAPAGSTWSSNTSPDLSPTRRPSGMSAITPTSERTDRAMRMIIADQPGAVS
jgi:hypothetical protein